MNMLLSQFCPWIIIFDHRAFLAFFRHVSKYSPQDFARSTLWNLIDNFDLLDPFVPHLLLLHVFDQGPASALGIVSLVLLKHNVCLGSFSRVVICNTEHGHIFHARMAKQEVFQFRWGDLVSVSIVSASATDRHLPARP